MQIEQAAQERAVQAVDPAARASAQQTATGFVEALYTRDWKTARQQWKDALAATASPELLARLDKDKDWESDAHQRFVAAKAASTGHVTQVQAQTQQDGRVEVALTVATQTTGEDPWIAVPRKERPVTVVVDTATNRVVEQIDMTPHGGL